jgi:outer membrane protein assembly factor BamB
MRVLKLLKFNSFCVVILICISNLSAQDWPQYLGPDRNSTSSQKNLLRSWPEGGPEMLWSVEVGIGYGGPIAMDGKIYLLDRDDKVGDYMRCFDLSTGKELWSYGYESPGSVMFPGSRSVPAVDGNYVYSCGLNGDLYCIDITTHKPVWNKNVWMDFGGKPNSSGGQQWGPREPGSFPSWAISQCPLVYGGLLIVASQAPDAGVVAYNKLTGDVIWKTPSLGEVGYVSPAMVKIDGKDHVVMITASGRGEGSAGNVVGIDPFSGKELWRYSGWTCHIPVPSAIDAGDNKVLIIGGYELGATMLRIGKKADGTYAATEVFTTEEFGDQTKPAILFEDYFYAQYGTNNRRDGLTCMSKDGEIMWKTKRDPDFNKGSMILADGLILATDGARTLFLIEPDPSGFKPLASVEILAEAGTGSENDPMASNVGGRTQNWAPLALADGRLLIRDQNRLYCVKVAE